jgi:hypothetical protein
MYPLEHPDQAILAALDLLVLLVLRRKSHQFQDGLRVISPPWDDEAATTAHH